MKIATLTYQRHDNYGAMLQCYALQKKIESYGIETEVIDYICDVSENPFGLRALRTKGIKKYITGSIGAITRLPRAKRFTEFRRLLKMSATVTKKNISQLGKEYDGFIVGSDNVWNTDITGLDEMYFLSFVADKRRRASYAASFGSSKIKESDKDRYTTLLADFAIINCREKSGAKLAADLTGKRTDTGCDPSILLTKEEWSDLAISPREKKPYLLAYQMVPSSGFVKLVRTVAKAKGLNVIYIPFPYGFLSCECKLSIGPLEWLGLFKEAEYILTDSFHGCAFSILFNKQFAVQISQLGERIDNILSIVDLKSRVVDTSNDVQDLPMIDYSIVNNKIELFRKESEDKLKQILKYFKGLKSNGITDPSQCTGCMLCKTICRTDAINIQRDELGFIYPIIDRDLCIVNCHACETVCKSISQPKAIVDQQYYSAIHNDSDIIKKSGSGGVFSALASQLIEKGGVVYGAAYQSGFLVAHEPARDMEQLERIRGTKYVQSTILTIYEKVAEDLISQKPVLFVGTPCQCAAVQRYVKFKKIEDTNFYCCDIFCHGVFSPQIWDEYLRFLEDKFQEKISYISFRDKDKGWRNKKLKIKTTSSDISDYCNNKASVLRLYEQNISFRESCYQCRYMNLKRRGDISIGDFWGIERVKPELDNNTGVSAVIVNNDKGRILLDSIKNEASFVEFRRQDIIQPALKEFTKKHSQRTTFIDEYKKAGIADILNKYGRVNGKLRIKRDYIIPLLYKLRIAGFASKILHLNDK